MKRTYYFISEQNAKTAHDMMSMRDYIPNTATSCYKNQVDEVYDLADKIAESKPKQAERAYRLAERYARRLADNINKENRIGMMCPSVMISGAGNFPVKKKEKQVSAWERNHEDMKEIQKIKNKMHSILHGKEPILSGDADAIERLEDKLEGLVAMQEQMKAANAYYRKNKTLEGCQELPPETIKKIQEAMEKDYFIWDQPFAPYSLQNNNANIKRTRERLEKLKEAKKFGSQERNTKFCKIVENTEMMRLQLIFEGKPNDETRTLLKSNGFRWAPSQSAWQRQLTPSAKSALGRVMQGLEAMQ